MEPLQSTAALPWGKPRWNSCGTPSQCVGTEGSGTPSVHRRTSLWQQIGDVLRYTATLPWGSEPCTPTVDRAAQGPPAVELLHLIAALPWGTWRCDSCSTLPDYLGAINNGPPPVLSHNASGYLVVELLKSTAASPWCRGQQTSCRTLPHYLVAVGSGMPTVHGRIALVLSALELWRYIAPRCWAGG